MNKLLLLITLLLSTSISIAKNNISSKLDNNFIKFSVIKKDSTTIKKDANATNKSNTANSGNRTADLFFSEYIEGSDNNKAIEIANTTDTPIDLSQYSIKKQLNGGIKGKKWESSLQLSGTLKPGEVYVIINAETTNDKLIQEADFMISSDLSEIMDFNGNDPLGLFKNNVLIDIIGRYNNIYHFAKDKTLRRKKGISKPNPNFNFNEEWEEYLVDTVDDIGGHNASVKIRAFLLSKLQIYANPKKENTPAEAIATFPINKFTIYNTEGKKITSIKNLKKTTNISSLKKGKYIIEFELNDETRTVGFTKK